MARGVWLSTSKPAASSSDGAAWPMEASQGSHGKRAKGKGRGSLAKAAQPRVPWGEGQGRPRVAKPKKLKKTKNPKKPKNTKKTKKQKKQKKNKKNKKNKKKQKT